MTTLRLTLLSLLLLVVVGCFQSSNQPPPPRKAFLDERKRIPPHLEWNRDLFSTNGATIEFRVTSSQGPFSVMFVTDKGREALLAGNKKAIGKEEMLLFVDSKESEQSLEGNVTVPAGRTWVIIENRAEKPSEVYLQCFDP